MMMFALSKLRKEGREPMELCRHKLNLTLIFLALAMQAELSCPNKAESRHGYDRTANGRQQLTRTNHHLQH